MKNAMLVFVWVLTGLSAFWGGMRYGSSGSESPEHTNRKEQAQEASARKAVPTNRVSYAVNRQADQLSEQGEVEQGFVPYEDVSREALTSEDLFERIQSSNPVVRMQAFAELLQNGDEESIQAAIEAYKKLPEGPVASVS